MAEEVSKPIEEAKPSTEQTSKPDNKPAKQHQTETKPEVLVKEVKSKFNFKLFGKWPWDVQVLDLGLKPYINLTPFYVPYSAGRAIKKQFWKSKKSIVERLMLKLMVTGHKAKKHYWTSGVQPGKLSTQYGLVKKTFEIIEQKTKKNPIEVFVRAIETGSPAEGIATIEYGGVRYHKAADLAPQRRVDLVLRWMTQGAFAGSRKNKRHVWEALADEIIGTANNDQVKSNSLAKKLELERQAAANR